MPLKVITRKDTGKLWITGTVAGHRIREPAGTTDRRLAEERRAAREAELYRHAVHGPAPAAASVTWEAACGSYMDAAAPSPGTNRLLLRLTDHFGQVVVRDIDQAAMDAAVKALCRPGAAAATKLRNVIVPTRAVLMHSARRGWCAPPLFETPAGAGGDSRTRWLTPDEYKRLVAAAPPRLRHLVTFLVCTGARIGEALRLEWTDVDLEDRRVVLRGVKAKHGQVRDRVIEDIPPAAIAALEAITRFARDASGKPIQVQDRTGRVFRDESGRPYRDTKDDGSGGQVKKVWGSACARAGFAGEWKGEGATRYFQPEDVTPHVLRHTYATWHYCVHKDPMRLQREGDWSALRLVERYTKLAPPRLAGAIRAIWHDSDTEPVMLAATG